MRNKVKSKKLPDNISNGIIRGEYQLMKTETGEMIEIEKLVKVKNITVKFITISKKGFMQYYDSVDMKKILYKQLGDYIKYVFLLSDYIDWRNSVDLYQFQYDYGIQDSIMTKIRQRLSAANILGKMNKKWYMNPMICNKGDKIEIELFDLFKKDNEEIYGVTVL